MELNDGQAAAVKMIGRFLEDTDALLARVTGYAGTGKTTLAKEMAQEYGRPEVLTPTGKAALRVSEATGLSASTIHRFLYDAKTDPKTGAPTFELKSMYAFDRLSHEGWVLIDEASMVSKQVWQHLESVASTVGFPVVVMGDLFQLPPVYKNQDEQGFNLLEEPTEYAVNLTEVHRQALDSPIIRASMILRSNEPEFRAMRLLRSVGEGEFLSEVDVVRARGGVVLCHSNARRHSINAAVRAHRGLAAGTLHPDEPLLVTQNNYQIDRYNGEVVEFRRWSRPPDRATIVKDRYTNSALEVYFGVGAVGVGAGESDVTIAVEEVAGRTDEAKIGAWHVRRAARAFNFGDDDEVPHLHANYGYGLTVHKAQGSEWPDVLVVLDDGLDRLRGQERRRWMYTALTRARENVSYVHLS